MMADKDGLALVDRQGLAGLIAALDGQGYTVIGPKVADGAIVFDRFTTDDELPEGWTDEQDGGTYRLLPSGDASLFAYSSGPHSAKRWLFPPSERLWRARRTADGFAMDEEAEDPPRYAFIGLRACDLRAIQIQDKVFDNGSFTDPHYFGRRERIFILAVNCGRAGDTCFCASMGSGPRVHAGFDLALTELIDAKRHDFLIEPGSERGAQLLAQVPSRPARPADVSAAEAAIASARAGMGRTMIPDVATVLKHNLEHPRWAEVAERCLKCGNCTLVCPTCFCSTTEEFTNLAGTTAERVRRWDSCFTSHFSYIHGGSIRREGSSRYRQWITHKLSNWHDQFGTSGCVGCGRCITWCPVAIDITEEARAIASDEGRM